MSIKASVGHAHGENPTKVGAEAYTNAVKGLDGAMPSIAFVFSSATYEQESMLQGVRSVSGSTPVVGCSTAGEIVNQGPLPDPSVAVMVISSQPEEMRFFTGVGMNAKNNERNAGKEAAEQVVTLAGGKDKLTGFILLGDGLVGNGAEMLRGVLDVLGENFPVVGGSSADDFRFKQTYQYALGRVHSGDIVGVGLAGNFAFGTGVKHGWGVLGLPARVTKADGAVIHEIDGKPAFEIYEKYFGERAKSLREETLATFAVSYPLGMKDPKNDEYLLRAPFSVDEHGSMTCTAEVPLGAEVRIMMGTRETAISMATQAAQKALADLGGKTPKAIFIFNCIARKKLLGMQSGEEIEAIQAVLGKDVPLIGLYTYGEHAPVNGETRHIERCNTVFHNETVVIYVIAE